MGNTRAATALDFSDLPDISDSVRRGNPSEVSDQLRRLKEQTDKHQGKIANRNGDFEDLIEDRRFVKSLSFLADAAYLRGDFVEARWHVKKAALWIREKILTSHERVTGSDLRRLRRQQVWLVACDAAASIRMGENVWAKTLLEQARAYVMGFLQCDDFPCHGTLARIEFYLGLLARNSGDQASARQSFDRATEMAIARCAGALNKKGRDATYRESEKLFKRRCLARLQAFGYGLSSLCEGKLLNARASFYFALALLENPNSERTGVASYHDELMATKVRLWLILIRALLVPFDDDGITQLKEMLSELKSLSSWFAREPGDFGPDRRLCDATESLVQLRIRQFQKSAPNQSKPITAYKHQGQKDADSTTLVTNLVLIWVAIDSEPQHALALINSLAFENVAIRFWRNEAHLAAAEAKVEAEATRIPSARPKDLTAIELALTEAIDTAESAVEQLTRGQAMFLDALRARAHLLLSEVCDCLSKSCQVTQDGKEGQTNDVNNPEVLRARSEHYRRQAACIALELRQRTVRSGILAWKIQKLPDDGLPTTLPLPHEVGYPLPDVNLTTLIAGRNAIVRCILNNPTMPKLDLARYVRQSIKLTPELARPYFDLFPELRKWLTAKGKQRTGFANDQRMVEGYLRFLRERANSKPLS